MEILNSWKEIANYVGRGVRTVQRWERDLGLPVHRPKGRDRSAVLAFPAEIDYWLRNTPVRVQGIEQMAQPVENRPRANNVERRSATVNVSRMQTLSHRSHTLMNSISQAARRHQVLAAGIHDSLLRLMQSGFQAGLRQACAASKSPPEPFQVSGELLVGAPEMSENLIEGQQALATAAVTSGNGRGVLLNPHSGPAGQKLP